MPISTETRKLRRQVEQACRRSSVNPDIARLERLIGSYERLLTPTRLRGIAAVTEEQQEMWRMVLSAAREELAVLHAESEKEGTDEE